MISGIKMLQGSTTSDATAPGAEKSVVVAHDQLGFDLVHRIHRNADDDKQTCSPEGELYADPFGKPLSQGVGPEDSVEPRTDGRDILDLDSLKHHLRQQGDEGQVYSPDSGEPFQYVVKVLGGPL